MSLCMSILIIASFALFLHERWERDEPRRWGENQHFLAERERQAEEQAQWVYNERERRAAARMEGRA